MVGVDLWKRLIITSASYVCIRYLGGKAEEGAALPVGELLPPYFFFFLEYVPYPIAVKTITNHIAGFSLMFSIRNVMKSIFSPID